MDFRIRYRDRIRKNCTNPETDIQDVNYWKNRLFSSLLTFALPFSLITILPTLYWSYLNDNYIMVSMLSTMVVCMLVVGFMPGISLHIRKIIFFGVAYSLNIGILIVDGSHGAGLVYLLTLAILANLIFSGKNSFWPAWLNTGICVLFGVLLANHILPEGHDHDISLAKWVAISSNLVFVSFLCVALIPRLFKHLQNTISKEILLKQALEMEKKTLDETSDALAKALEDNLKTMNSSLDVICKVSADGKFIHVSAACEEVWGYTPEELIGKPTIDYVFSEDREATIQTANRVRMGENAVDFENRYVHKDGSLVPISWAVRWDEADQIRYAVARNISEKKKLEQALEAGRQRLFSFFQEAPMSMGMLSGPDHVFTVANPLYYKLIGQMDIIGKTIREVIPDIDQQGYLEVLDKVYQTGESYSGTEALVQFEIDGEKIDKYLNFNVQAHYSEEGEIDGLLFFIAEVTEQVLSRKLIEISESRLNDAQALSKMGNWNIDLTTNTHFWSDEIYELFGIPKGSVQPGEENFMAFTHPDDLENAYVHINHGFETHENISFSFRYIRTDGVVRHGFHQWKFSFDPSGHPIQLSGIMQDVTEQMESEEQLRNSEGFSRGVLNSLNSNIAVIDFNGMIVAANESWEEFGQFNSPGTLQGMKPGADYFAVVESAAGAGIEYASNAMQGIREVMNDTLEVFYLEYESHSDQDDRWYGMRVMKFEGGEPLLVISHQNISERKQAESERRKAAEELMQRNKDLEQFTYIVSHNLRSPVANIQGLVGILNTTELDRAEQLSITAALNDSVDSLDEVVKDLNEILHLRDTLVENLEVIRFAHLVEQIKVSIRNMIDSHDIQIRYDFNEMDRMSSLKSYMHSIFYNLISNSIKYRRSDVPCIINISSRLVNNRPQLTFSDNGLGIDLSKKGEQVFGLYKRFHSHVDGKGLGLFMVKTQVEKLGGKISVKSTVNVGTEFVIDFSSL